MGIKTTTVTTCTCDICTAECRQDDRRIIIDVKPAERDIGPSQPRHVIRFCGEFIASYATQQEAETQLETLRTNRDKELVA